MDESIYPAGSSGGGGSVGVDGLYGSTGDDDVG